MADDSALLQAWREGDAVSGNQLFERYFPRMYRFFAHKSPDRIEDLIQETFLACVRGRDAFRGEASFKTYLYGIAVNVLKADLRRRSKADMLDFGVTSIADLGPTPSQLAAAEQERALLLEAMRRIPLDHQVVIELHFLEGLRGPEIAVALDIAEGTVRSRLRRGLDRLRRSFKELGLSNEAFDNLERGSYRSDEAAPDTQRSPS
ncbi:MAG: sigma-70 family RNA polymerase sigma factor [Myxococcota bacterium]